MRFLLFPVFAAVLLTAPAAMAGSPAGMKHDGMAMPDATAPADVYAPAMESMHKNMMGVKPTGDADVDFMQEMIPHHQGAIDMAKIALKEAKDPAVRKMAQDIVDAQEKEIAFMKNWLKAHGKQ